jgi:hypothetical protein
VSDSKTAWGIKGPSGISTNCIRHTQKHAEMDRQTAINQHKDKAAREQAAEDITVVQLLIMEIP